MTMIFTRYLYNYNDAKYSLILAILKGSDFNEILFWADEIYHSGFKDELWQLLIKFYLDFCYINQYLYSKTIVKSYKDWKEKMILNLSLKLSNISTISIKIILYLN